MSDFIDTILAMLPGLGTSLLLTGGSLAIGLPLGVLAGQLLTGRLRIIRWIVTGFVEIFRGVPALVTLYLVYFGLPAVDIVLTGTVSVFVAFGVTSAAYTAEIFRAAFENLPRGQREAASALALPPRQTFLLIELPHAIRVAWPPLLGIAIITFQGTALAFAIGLKDLLGSGYARGIIDGNLFSNLAAVGVLYLIVTALLTYVEVLGLRRSKKLAAGRLSAVVAPA
jgi:His/Glu/Gln/Arg/opine family amino acid ABC transporter permease subunit